MFENGLHRKDAIFVIVPLSVLHFLITVPKKIARNVGNTCCVTRIRLKMFQIMYGPMSYGTKVSISFTIRPKEAIISPIAEFHKLFRTLYL